jgi:AAA domain/Toprim-like
MIDDFLAAIEQTTRRPVRRSGRGWIASCPCPGHKHDDRKPSLSISAGEAQPIVCHCHVSAEHDFEAVCTALGVNTTDYMNPNGDRPWTPPRRPQRPQTTRRPAAPKPDEGVLEALWKIKRWTREAIERLGVGFDGERLVLGGVRYAPAPLRGDDEPKTKALPGSKRELWPAPEDIVADRLGLVEGEPDAVSCWSAGIPAVAVPGTNGWRSEYAERFRGRDVVVCMDCDGDGRKAAKRIASDLVGVASSVRVLDLAPERSDGFDIGDALAEDVETIEQLRQAGDLLRDQAARIEPEQPPARDGVIVTWAADIRREQVDWLWPGRVPRATLTVVIGVPGLGKSLLTCKLAAEASKRGECGLMLTAEDAQAFVVEPRLAAWDADMGRIGFVSMRRSGFLEDLALPDDVQALRSKAIEHEAKLIVIDPLAAHFSGGVDPFRDPSVRRALAPLRRLAEEIGVAIIVVIHLNKGTGTDPIMRAGGSIGQMGAARSALLVANDPDDPDGEDGASRVVAHVKCNLAPRAGSLRFAIEQIELDDAARTHTARIIHVGDSEHSGRDLLAAAVNAGTGGSEGSKLQQAISYLVMRLGDEPKERRALVNGAKLIGISERTLERAKRELGVIAERISVESEGRGAGLWKWRLPDPGEQSGADEDDE